MQPCQIRVIHDTLYTCGAHKQQAGLRLMIKVADHWFCVKGFSTCGQSLSFCGAELGSPGGSVIKTFPATFGAEIISLDELNISWWS